MTKLIVSMLACLVVLAGCKTSEEAVTQPALTSEQIAEIEAKWLGKWSGAWGENGDCKSSIEVHEVIGTTAAATYSWDALCGGASTPAGSHRDNKARISGNVLEVDMPWVSVRYQLREDGNLDGEWSLKARKLTAQATFYKDGNQEGAVKQPPEGGPFDGRWIAEASLHSSSPKVKCGYQMINMTVFNGQIEGKLKIGSGHLRDAAAGVYPFTGSIGQDGRMKANGQGLSLSGDASSEGSRVSGSWDAYSVGCKGTFSGQRKS